LEGAFFLYTDIGRQVIFAVSLEESAERADLRLDVVGGMGFFEGFGAEFEVGLRAERAWVGLEAFAGGCSTCI
jgi:hypothetical protein